MQNNNTVEAAMLAHAILLILERSRKLAPKLDSASSEEARCFAEMQASVTWELAGLDILDVRQEVASATALVAASLKLVCVMRAILGVPDAVSVEHSLS